MNRLVSLALLLVALIHLLPLSGVLGSERLSAQYGISFDEPNIEILMRHRAVLFGLLGVFLLYAAFHKRLHLTALAVGAVSVMSFLTIAKSVGGYNSEIARVFVVDMVALVCLVLGLIIFVILKLHKK